MGLTGLETVTLPTSCVLKDTFDQTVMTVLMMRLFFA
jgi:hypothetical protein